MDSSTSHSPLDASTSTLFPRIGKLKDVLYEARKRNIDSLDLIGTVKLHGTHADLVINADDQVRCQSRNQLDLQPTHDNIGFATFAAPLKRDIVNLKNTIIARYRKLNPSTPFSAQHPVIIAGEWCGVGIQKKVALNRLNKQFVIISIKCNNRWLPNVGYCDINNEPIGIYNIARAGFFHISLALDCIGEAEAELEDLTKQVVKECPYARTFGVLGTGEGIVWKTREYVSKPDFWFKSKGEMFEVTAHRKLPASSKVLKYDSRVHDFAMAIVTDNRMEQGLDFLKEMEVTMDMKGLGTFLKWIVEDCLKEESIEMEEAGINEKNLKPAITNIAKDWYQARVGASISGNNKDDP